MGLGICRGASRPVGRWFVLVASSAVILLGSHQGAFASAGCDAVNAGGFTASQIGAGLGPSPTIAGFTAGDRIVFTVAIAGGVAEWRLWTGGFSRNITVAGGSTVYSYVITGTDDTSLASALGSSGGDITVTAVCTPASASSSSTSTDSQKLRSVQVQGSTMVAQASGAAITGAVGNAINDAFSGGATPVSSVRAA